MEQHNSDISRISQHLDELNREHRRKQALQTSIIFGGIIVLFLIGFLLTRVFFLSPSGEGARPDDQGVFALEALSPDQVQDFFNSGESSMIVKYGELFVTLYSEEDYWDIMEKISGKDTDRFTSDAFNAFDTMYTDPGTLDPFVSLGSDNEVNSPEETPLATDGKIIIQGVRSANSALRFTISNYDPRITYTVDFGDGDIEKGMLQEFFHEYEKGGVYSVELKGDFEGDELFSVVRKVKVDDEKEARPPILAQRERRTPRKKPATSANQHTSNTSPQEDRQPQRITADENLLSPLDPTIEIPVPVGLNPTDNAGSSDAAMLGEGAEDLDTSSDEVLTSEGLISSAASPEIYSDPSYTDRGGQALRRYKKTYMAPLQIASKMPSFPGGSAAMISFLNERLTYPQAAKDFNVEGDVFVQFVVDEEGAIRNTQVVRGLGYGCDKEALRIVKEMPRWIPGRNKGEIVPVICTIQINFSLI